MASSSNDLSRVAGSQDMAKPGARSGITGRPQAGRQNTNVPSGAESSAAPKKKRHRGGKNRKKRRQSFVAPSENESAIDTEERPSILNVPNARQSANQASFYRLRQGNRSNTSLESEALLDHRDQQVPTARRRSIQQGFARPSIPFARQQHHRGSSNSTQQPSNLQRQRPVRDQRSPIGEHEDEEEDTNDRTPLLSRGNNQTRPDLPRHPSAQNYGASHGTHRTRRSSAHSKASSKKRVDFGAHRHPDENDEDYDVNNPPSVPNSPQLGSLDDIMVADLTNNDRGRDAIINIDYEDNQDLASGSPDARRRTTVADLAERDVCFPGDGSLSDGGDADDDRRSHTSSRRLKRRRTKQWPDLEVLDEFSREEKEARTQEEYLRVKKISEPVMVDGRLRQRKATAWHREEDEAPFRFTYFNELFDSTIHARTISDLCQDGGTFKDLFIPDPVELSDESDSEPEDETPAEKPPPTAAPNGGDNNTANSKAAVGGLQGDLGVDKSEPTSKSNTGSNTPSGRNQSVTPAPFPPEKARTKRYGNRPTFWLDVLNPSEIEMKVLAKAFGIHQLTIEDILMDEPREKVELFQSYYFVNYRSFEQDKDNEDYMEPINMFVVVFRDGVITFHHSMTPHPANVRRRIRQLNDYMSPTADWISYAIIDDVTDVYAPLVQQIEEEVDDIDDEILYMHTNSADAAVPKDSKGKNKVNQGEKTDAKSQGDMGTAKTEGEKTAGESGGDMLRRVGECRKKVMGLYRLLGNKADVIKGFAKRCNEHWEVAPRSEIGLYLGDIQDHIVTMTGNLSHYEK